MILAPDFVISFTKYGGIGLSYHPWISLDVEVPIPTKSPFGDMNSGCEQRLARAGVAGGGSVDEDAEITVD
jgi:hypothetical protein